MSHISIFDTTFAQNIQAEKQAKESARFIIANRGAALTADQMTEILRTPVFAQTPISLIYEHLKVKGKLEQLFVPAHYGNVQDSVPEILTTAFTFDTAQLPDAGALSTLPEYRNKVLLNLSQLVKLQAQGRVMVSDINEVMSLFVRGFLVMSYFDNDNWLSPQLLAYVVKSYSMTVSYAISRSRLLNLTLPEQMTVAAILALYFCQKVQSPKDSLTHPPLFNRCTFLGDQKKLADIADSMATVSSQGLNMTLVCELMREHGPDRMKEFDPRMLNLAIINQGTSQIDMLLAAEYPPYWIHQILSALSGIKTPLANQLKTLRLYDEGKKFAFELNSSKMFVDNVQR